MHNASQSGEAEDGAKRIACRHCSTPFVPRNSQAMYCSKTCKHQAWAKADPGRASLQRQRDRRPEPTVCTVFFGCCAHCGCSIMAKRPKTYCSPECRLRSRVRVAPSVQMQCSHCLLDFLSPNTGGRRSVYCGPACKAEASRPGRRANRLRRKASEKAAFVETVDPIKVFDRDGWSCRLCGIQTPKAHRGTYRPDAPELDHVVPLSRGGEHSYRNTQCLCRQCNAGKSNSIPVDSQRVA